MSTGIFNEYFLFTHFSLRFELFKLIVDFMIWSVLFTIVEMKLINKKQSYLLMIINNRVLLCFSIPKSYGKIRKEIFVE